MAFSLNGAGMKKESGAPLYIGVNFVVTPSITLGLDHRIKFQQQLEEFGVNITDINFDKQSSSLLVVRKSPMPIEIRIVSPAPQVNQLLIIAPDIDGRSIEGVGQEALDIVRAFTTVWPNRQIIQADATIRNLYESTENHAFQELWERFLKQPAENLSAFKRPVLGGGLRFVIPQTDNDPALPQIDIKIESFLSNTHKFFIEVSCLWTQPQGNILDPDGKLAFVDNFIQNEVMSFMLQGG